MTPITTATTAALPRLLFPVGPARFVPQHKMGTARKKGKRDAREQNDAKTGGNRLASNAVGWRPCGPSGCPGGGQPGNPRGTPARALHGTVTVIYCIQGIQTRIKDDRIESLRAGSLISSRST